MEQPSSSSSSKVTVEYHDPHDVYKLLAPGLIPRLPLRDLHWQSHNGPVRSIQTLHVELVPAGSAPGFAPPSITSPPPKPADRDDGFQTASLGGRPGSTDQIDSTAAAAPRAAGAAGKERRHQIPGLRRTPYLKILLVRCDDNETYKATTRAEIREWIKTHTPSKPTSNAENHDAFEWLIVHVVIPNTTAATQPRLSGSKAPESSSDATTKTATSRWRGGSSTLLEKLRSDFNGSSKSAVDRVRQIRIGINDVPYDILPRVVPAVPTGYHETEQDSINAWADLIGKFKELILSCFDTRVSQYEDDIKERDGQRALPGWNFCTFFILKEGLARGFESVGLVEDALVGYDELSVGLDAIIQEQAVTGNAEAHGGALLSHTEELKSIAQKVIDLASRGNMDDEEAVDLQPGDKALVDNFHNIPVSSSKKAYRELILANNVSLFDFRCYIFARQISLLLRLGNASSSREELLAKLKEQQELVPRGVAPTTPMPSQTDEAENLSHLAEICRRTLEFVPAISMVARKDLLSSIVPTNDSGALADAIVVEIVDNVVASFAFSVAQQILAQTSTKALPIPPSTLTVPDGHEPKAAIPEPKTMMHPARNSSLNIRAGQRPPPSPIGFPPVRGPEDNTSFIKTGLEELAARRAELYSLSRNILEECGKKRGWSGGWAAIPMVGEPGVAEMDDISLDDDESMSKPRVADVAAGVQASIAGLNNNLLRTALNSTDDFYRLYEILTDKALRHYTVASYDHSIQTCMADLAILKFHLGQYSEASFFFYRTIPSFGDSGWSLLELSMLLMYAKCLKELRKLDDYVNKALRQLLSKAAAAEKERIRQKSLIGFGGKPKPQYPESSSMSGLFTDLLNISLSLDKEVRIPLTSLLCDVELDGPPIYDHRQDSFSVYLRLHSLIVDTFEAKKISLRISGSAGSNKEIWLLSKGPVTIKPGKNKVQLQSSVMAAGSYEVDQIRLSSANVLLHYERDVGQLTDTASGALKHHKINLYQRAGSLDARLLSTKEVRLDRNNSLELEVLSGWNNITSCEVKIRSATGGVRLLMSEASVLGSLQPTKRSEGVFTFGAFPENTSIKIKFPFTVENDLVNVAVKAEVSYSTEQGDFTFSRTSSVPITLALGVNVQDVFKHDKLFSRFTVSSASDSPLRLLKSELLESDMFESQFGAPPSHPILVFPKQPASLLYRIRRKAGTRVTPKKNQTMHLRLYYSVVQEEIEQLLEKKLMEEMGQAELQEYSALVVSKVVSLVPGGLSGYDLEKAALLGDFTTEFLAEVRWEKQFPGLGHLADSAHGDIPPPVVIASFLNDWLKQHPKLSLPNPDLSTAQPSTIVIPVDIPPITIVHTADIQFQQPLASMDAGTAGSSVGYPTVCTNQVLPATLHLKWTRVWDTAAPDTTRLAPTAKAPSHTGGRSEDLEFGYEITAPPDTWLLGGRRKGHFVIPAMPDPDGEESLTSTPDTEADIPLLLIPLREGWLPFPSVEIREVKGGSTLENGVGAGNGVGNHHCEMDYRNLGETVHVIADRAKVTLSLDASGPGGGPLVLESERLVMEGRVVA
ncbi:trafficking protein particle complex subunit 10 [Cercophora newfieldiana]|uniref:Trafficking protein particle complex subunit 10 n=1 Tax=Cercophora newfieldiana TaxID=92897 RepID=A0AA40CSD6_9PEZI|nr:trafficking protein particle complex subunit 10 [Cercophora newfieldiana]